MWFLPVGSVLIPTGRLPGGAGLIRLGHAGSGSRRPPWQGERQAPVRPCSASRPPGGGAAKSHTRQRTALRHGSWPRRARRSPNASPHSPASWKLAALDAATSQRNAARLCDRGSLPRWAGRSPHPRGGHPYDSAAPDPGGRRATTAREPSVTSPRASHRRRSSPAVGRSDPLPSSGGGGPGLHAAVA